MCYYGKKKSCDSLSQLFYRMNYTALEVVYLLAYNS